MSLKDYIQTKPVLETPRLTLRPLVPEDIPALREWTGDKELYAYWGKAAGRTDKDPGLLFAGERRATKSFHWGIAARENHRVSGELWVYLIENNRMAKVALRVAPKCQGQGYASEALQAATRFCFERTELRRLWTDVDVRNTASCRVLEKCGFTREGLVRQGKMVSVWCDYYLYGMLKEDFQARN